jgi:hypothetical protein
VIDVGALGGFLHRRYDEQERIATETLAHNQRARAGGTASTLWDEQDQDAQQVQREVAANRRIVDTCLRYAGQPTDVGRLALHVLVCLAHPLAQHPEYAAIAGGADVQPADEEVSGA